MELKQESDFDNNDEIITKIFKVKDVFFNNGIVNLYQFLKENEFDINFLYEDNLLKISYQEKNSDIYFEILKKFLKEKNIVSFNEKNERIFFDTTLNKFVQSKKINIKNGGSNDSKNSLIRIHIDELKISQSQLLKEEEKYLSKYENSDKEDFKISKCYYDKFKKELYVLSTLDEHIERFSSYLVKEDNLNLNSSIHSFEDGQKSFHDMCKLSKSYTIDKWEALIYWFGTKTQHFYNFSYHMYPNSSNLEALDIFKNEIRINDKKKSFRDEKEKLITTNSNIDFYEQLRKDSIIGKKFTYFFMSKSDVEFELKFFIYLFSKIHHIEDEYINANNRRKNSKEKIYKALKEITFVTYVEDGTFKRSLTEYTKAYLILQFFDKLIEKDLFIYLANLFVTFSMSQGGKEINLNLQKWCKKLLEFKSLRKEYYLVSFNILKNNKAKSFGKSLFDFEQLYLQNILGEKDMNIHEKSKVLGSSIGHFCAEVGDKDLLFKLRNVKNYKQLLTYFKDLKFSSLKNENKARFSKEFNESLEEILNVLEKEWEIIRDYIAIYAIDKFKAVSFAKSNNKQ